MQLRMQINNIQHITSFNIELESNQYGLKCIVGKNGVGKTTIIKAIRNLSMSDTFAKTSPDNIFTVDSSITYYLNGETYSFDYDPTTKALELNKPIPSILRKNIDVELPIPHGRRFNFFKSISDANTAIVKAIAFESYKQPTELIDLLNKIYSTEKFNKLIEVEDRGDSYYALLVDGDRYIREDYLSSGEFFIISLFRKIMNRKRFIIIDEIDISLDAAAQVFLVKKLREYSKAYSITILFTTHSLALMKTLRNNELFYLTNEDGKAEITEVSYNYMKSILFGFHDWDKYILTEDDTLQGYIEYLINKFCPDSFYRYKIIYIGGGTNVVNLMERNIKEQFLSSPENVICILDGDQKGERYTLGHENIYCIPQQSVEKDLHASYINDDEGIPKLATRYQSSANNPKSLYEKLINGEQCLMSRNAVYDFVTKKHSSDIEIFVNNLRSFLGNIGNN